VSFPDEETFLDENKLLKIINTLELERAVSRTDLFLTTIHSLQTNLSLVAPYEDDDATTGICNRLRILTIRMLLDNGSEFVSMSKALVLQLLTHAGFPVYPTR
jgi:hypothetical protein